MSGRKLAVNDIFGARSILEPRPSKERILHEYYTRAFRPGNSRLARQGSGGRTRFGEAPVIRIPFRGLLQTQCAPATQPLTNSGAAPKNYSPSSEALYFLRPPVEFG